MIVDLNDKLQICLRKSLMDGNLQKKKIAILLDYILI